MAEADELREDISLLEVILDTISSDDRASELLQEACFNVLRDRRDRLAQLEHDDGAP